MTDCNHSKMELRRMEMSNGGIQYKMQCLNCGTGGTAIAYSSLTEEEKAAALPFDRAIAERYWLMRRDEHKRQFNEQKWWNEYQVYLQCFNR